MKNVAWCSKNLTHISAYGDNDGDDDDKGVGEAKNVEEDNDDDIKMPSWVGSFDSSDNDDDDGGDKAVQTEKAAEAEAKVEDKPKKLGKKKLAEVDLDALVSAVADQVIEKTGSKVKDDVINAVDERRVKERNDAVFARAKKIHSQCTPRLEKLVEKARAIPGLTPEHEDVLGRTVTSAIIDAADGDDTMFKTVFSPRFLTAFCILQGIDESEPQMIKGEFSSDPLGAEYDEDEVRLSRKDLKAIKKAGVDPSKINLNAEKEKAKLRAGFGLGGNDD